MDSAAHRELSISIVSHRHGPMVQGLLEDLARLAPGRTEILLTLNVDEEIVLPNTPHPAIRVIRNSTPKGYGANHNAAFRSSLGRFFCVLNPDLHLPNDPFPELLCTASQSATGIVAPPVVDAAGCIQDNARAFPTAALLARKALYRLIFGRRLVPRPPLQIDWVSGVFMVFRREVFAELGGFDEGYFLYYEDVDICARALRLGYAVRLCDSACVVHDARFDSHRRFRYSRWHITSMLRYFRKWPRLALGRGLPAAAPGEASAAQQDSRLT